MSFSSNPAGIPMGVMAQANPFGGSPFPAPLPARVFVGVPGLNPAMIPPTAMAVPGLPLGLLPGMSQPVSTGAPFSIDPLTGRPMSLQGSPLPPQGPLPMPLSNPATFPFQPATSVEDSPVMGVFKTLMSSLQTLLGLPVSGDTDPMASSHEPAPISDPASALTTLLSEAKGIASANGDSGSISTADLAVVARNKGGQYSADAQAAAQYLLSNPKVWSAVDRLKGPQDTKATVQDISAALSSANVLDAASQEHETADSSSFEETLDTVSAVDLLNASFSDLADFDEDHNSVSFTDLSRAARDSEDEEVQALARYLMKNPELFKRIQGAKADKGRGITEDDLEAALGDSDLLSSNTEQLKAQSPQNAKDAYGILKKAIDAGTLATGNFDNKGNWSWAQSGGTGKFVDIKTIKAIASGAQDAPYELREACQWIVQNTGQLNKLEMYENMDGSDDDGLQVDLIQAIAEQGDIEENFGLDVGNQNVVSAADKKKAKEIFARNDNALLKKIDAIQGGSPDGVISNQDMWAAVRDRTGKFTVEEKRAILTVIGGDDGNVDGSIWDNINDGDEKASYEEFFRDVEQ